MSLRNSFGEILQRRLGSRLLDRNAIVPLLVLALGLGLATIFQVWLGYRATQQWRTSANMVVERRANEVASLMIIALIRDMRGAYESTLAPLGKEQLLSDSPAELSDIIARAFARFPYPDCFFAWSKQKSTDSAFLFMRADRPPIWDKTTMEGGDSFPVTTVLASSVALKLASSARSYALRHDQFAFFDTTIDGSSYQVVARLFRGGASNREVVAVLGFTVSLEWVTAKYFSEFTQQIERLVGRQEALSLSIVDDGGRTITQTRPQNLGGPSQQKKFPVAFFDSSAVPLSALDHMTLRRWTARVSAADDRLLGAADAGAKRTWALILIAASVSAIAVLLVIRFLRMNLELFAMKADFVAMVSHELKTPLAGISLAGQALSKGRFSSEQIVDYGALIAKESIRLTRLVENLLSFSRITRAKTLYSVTDVDLGEVVNEAVARLHTHIHERRATVRCQIPDDLPEVRCDREAITQVLVSLIENAIKYSDELTEIEISADHISNQVSVSVADKGHGILPEDVPHVFERFFRGKNAGLNGTGLGLALARKIIEDHGGHISIVSKSGLGTVVKLTLPAVLEMRA